MKTIIAAAAILVAASSAAFAYSADTRLRAQNNRIEAGRESGQITWREGIRLRRQQADIMRAQARLRADGYLGRSDRRTLHLMQDEAARDIARKQNNGWWRVWWLPRFGR